VAYVVVVLTASMFLGPGAVLDSPGRPRVVAGSFGRGRALESRWFTPLQETLALVINLSLLTLACALVVFIIRQNMAEQETYFSQSRLANLEIEQRAAGEAAQRRRLQSTVELYAGYMTEVGQGSWPPGCRRQAPPGSGAR